MFVNSFTNIEPNISKKISYFSKSLTDYKLNSSYLYPTNNDGINTIIKNFKNGKSSGPNSIRNSKILKSNLDILSLPLSNLTKMHCGSEADLGLLRPQDGVLSNASVHYISIFRNWHCYKIYNMVFVINSELLML